MKYIIIPESGEKVTVGAIIQLSSSNDTKYVLLDGLYIYDDTQFSGLFLSSIPDRIIIPIANVDLSTIVVISPGSGDCNCDCEPSVAPPPPHRAYNCVEEYMEHMAYHTGQLVWLNSGEVYQVAHDFVSSSSESTIESNFSLDVTAKYLVPISEKVSNTVGLAYAVDFESIFQTDSPSKEQADVYLSMLNPPIPPSSGITFVNTNPNSKTFTMSFMYCQDENTLIFIPIDDNMRTTISNIEEKIVDISPITNIELEAMLI